jgi:hypothetical protein
MVGAISSSWPRSPALGLLLRRRGGSTRSSRSERTRNGLLSEQRLGVRQQQIAPLVAALGTWMCKQRTRMYRYAAVGKATDYMLTRQGACSRFLSDGRICLTNKANDREMHDVAHDRKA